MGQDFFYCSELSRGSAERGYGTASTGEFWLLLEYPFGWGKKPLDESNLAPTIKRSLKRFLREVPRSRLLFVKQGSDCGERVSLLIVHARESDPYMVRFELEDYKQLVELDLVAACSGRAEEAGGVVSRDPVYLVCTHGRRDKCCAKFGLPLFKSLREEAGAAVWQSSHVGGDRFAANLVCFPHGLFFAHLTGETGRAVMREYEAGRLALGNYRGRACYSHPVQAAEFFARAESGLQGVESLRRSTLARLGEESWLVKFLDTRGEGGGTHAVRLSRHMSSFQNFITCGSAEPHPVPQYRLDGYEFKESSSQF